MTKFADCGKVNNGRFVRIADVEQNFIPASPRRAILIPIFCPKRPSTDGGASESHQLRSTCWAPIGGGAGVGSESDQRRRENL